MTAMHSITALDGADAAKGILTSATTLFEYLTTALALTRDQELVRAIRAVTSPDPQLSLSFGKYGPFVNLRGDAVVGSSLASSRSIADAPARVVDLQALLASERSVGEALTRAYARTHVFPEVAGWLRAFSSGGDAMPRETFRAIAMWQPLIAVESYRHLTYVGAALDNERRDLLERASRGDADSRTLLSYWTLVHAIGNATLLATMGEEREWLSDLVANAPLGVWTPSFVLVRERCFRLGLRAGWSAAAFGEAVIPRYLDALRRAVAPLRAFDAVLGLTAIGVRHPDVAPSIRREIQSALEAPLAAAPLYADLFDALHRSAEITLTDPSRAARLTRERAARLALRRSERIDDESISTLNGLDGDDDCATLEDGFFPCVLALAMVVSNSAEDLFRPASELARAQSHALVHERARTVLLRTGVVSSASSRTRWSN